MSIVDGWNLILRVYGQNIESIGEVCNIRPSPLGNNTALICALYRASGGFIAPFITPEIPWDFRLENVKSINTSGHKFGLVYPVCAYEPIKEIALVMWAFSQIIVNCG